MPLLLVLASFCLIFSLYAALRWTPKKKNLSVDNKKIAYQGIYGRWSILLDQVGEVTVRRCLLGYPNPNISKKTKASKLPMASQNGYEVLIETIDGSDYVIEKLESREVANWLQKLIVAAVTSRDLSTEEDVPAELDVIAQEAAKRKSRLR